MTAAAIWEIFQEAYCGPGGQPADSGRTPESGLVLAGFESSGDAGTERTVVTLRSGGDSGGDAETVTEHVGVGPVEALTAALANVGVDVEVLELHQSSIGAGNASEAMTLIEFRHARGTAWAAGRHRSTLRATLAAVMAAAARA